MGWLSRWWWIIIWVAVSFTVFFSLKLAEDDLRLDLRIFLATVLFTPQRLDQIDNSTLAFQKTSPCSLSILHEASPQ